MHIGMIVRGYPPEKVGGAEYQAQKLAQKLSLDGYDVTVFAGSQFRRRAVESPHHMVIKVKYRNIKLARIFLTPLIAFLPRIREFAPRLDILICYQVIFAGVVGLFSKLIYKIPLVIWFRAESGYKSVLAKYFFTPLILKFSDLSIVQSGEIKEQIVCSAFYRRLLGSRKLAEIRVIPNGIDLLDAPAIPYSERAGVLYVGRLHKVKGLQYLFRAMQGLDEKLWVIGQGPERERLFRMSANIRAEFLGELPQQEVFAYMRRAKFLVLPSLSEALPNVILEAMSAGLPTIATRVGGVPGLVIHRRTGFLVEPGDFEQLREHMRILLADDSLGEAMSRACREEIKRFSWPAILKIFEDAILSVHRRGGRRNNHTAPVE
jgi:glycosyltransferase involved in cell wall biosynthesis